MAMKKKAAPKKRVAKKKVTTKTLDISTTDFDRPVISIDGQKYEMRPPEELTHFEFAQQIRIAERNLAIINEGVSEEGFVELQELTSEAIHLMLVDVPDAVVAKITPGLYGKIQAFFNKLTDADEATVSENDSESSPGASDSTEASEE